MKAAQKPFLLAINGSPHTDGTVMHVVQKILTAAKKAGAETKTIHLYELSQRLELGLYSEDPKLAIVKNMPADGITQIYPEILRADAIIFATPTYWANMSAAMKSFIEHLTPLENDGFQLAGKVGIVVAASKENEGGVEMAAMAVVAAITQMGFLIPPNGVLWTPGYWHTTTGETTNWAEEDAPRLGKNVVQLVELLRTKKIKW